MEAQKRKTMILDDFYEWQVPKFYGQSDTNCLAENNRQKTVY
jgi:hypothetical protein